MTHASCGISSDFEKTVPYPHPLPEADAGRDNPIALGSAVDPTLVYVEASFV